MEDSETLIWQYMEQNWVVSFTAVKDQETWSANAFYVVEKASKSLLLLSSENTKHGQMLLQNPIVSGTISNQEKEVSLLKGLQFVGKMQLLEKEKAVQAFELYCQHFPIARNMKETVWRLTFSQLKYTDNSLGFGTKLYWNEK